MKKDEAKRTKYSDELLSAVKNWIQNCNHVKADPCKGETVIQRDQDGNIVRDPITRLPIKIKKMMMVCNPRELHNHMISELLSAVDGNQVLISENMLQKLLNTSICHVKMMTNVQKEMCGCQTCVMFDEMQRSLVVFRKKYIASLKARCEQMAEGASRDDEEEKLKQYIESVCVVTDDCVYPKHATGWEAASMLGCPDVEVGSKTYTRLKCALQNCHHCNQKCEEILPEM